MKTYIGWAIGIIGILLAMYFGGQNKIYKNTLGQVNQKANSIVNNYNFSSIPAIMQKEIKDIQSVSGDTVVAR